MEQGTISSTVSENLKTLTKSFSETVFRMASVVALANEALRSLIDDESSTRITRSFGEVDAVTYQAEVLKSYISRELRGLCHTDDSSSGGQAIAANGKSFRLDIQEYKTV